ncbi:hypothetical protein QJS10_CPA10g00438 [Acorus calamus]|uniref:Uncharacterized protein n=1 Tax=Acorus calamus TaxID=4465 RepID=A0AAV9DXM1_ACOCL|nr:hypothetical protein QJS10_CPA10g00438 [Acorus calamus]
MKVGEEIEREGEGFTGEAESLLGDRAGDTDPLLEIRAGSVCRGSSDEINDEEGEEDEEEDIEPASAPCCRICLEYDADPGA